MGVPSVRVGLFSSSSPPRETARKQFKLNVTDAKSAGYK